MEAPVPVCLFSIAVLCCSFATLVRAAEAEEEKRRAAQETAKDEMKKEESEKKVDVRIPQQEVIKLVSVDRIAMRLGACAGGFAIFEVLRTNLIPMVARAVTETMSPDLAMYGAGLLLGTGLILADKRPEERKKKV